MNGFLVLNGDDGPPSPSFPIEVTADCAVIVLTAQPATVVSAAPVLPTSLITGIARVVPTIRGRLTVLGGS